MTAPKTNCVVASPSSIRGVITYGEVDSAESLYEAASGIDPALRRSGYQRFDGGLAYKIPGMVPPSLLVRRDTCDIRRTVLYPRFHIVDRHYVSS